MPSVSAPSTSSGYGAASAVGLALEGEQADLGSVAVGDDDVVLGRELGDRLDGGGDVRALASRRPRALRGAAARCLRGRRRRAWLRPPNLR